MKLDYDKLEQYELSNFDLLKILGKGTNIVKYPDFVNYDDITQCFNNKPYCIVFFETLNNITGHWQLLLINKSKKRLEFFDPYGISCKETPSRISKKIRIKLKENVNILYKLLKKFQAENQNWFVTENKFPYQKMAANVDTCGRHCAVRALKYKLTEDQYYNYLSKYMKDNNLLDYDECVVNLTYDVIDK